MALSLSLFFWHLLIVLRWTQYFERFASSKCSQQSWISSIQVSVNQGSVLRFVRETNSEGIHQIKYQNRHCGWAISSVNSLDCLCCQGSRYQFRRLPLWLLFSTSRVEEKKKEIHRGIWTRACTLTEVYTHISSFYAPLVQLSSLVEKGLALDHNLSFMYFLVPK